MLRRLHTVMVYALVALFISMSTTAAVVASVSKPSPLLSLQGGQMDHSKMDHSKTGDAHHDHEQALTDVKGARDCLDFCFEGVADEYLSTSALSFPVPEFNAFTPASINRPGFDARLRSSDYSGSARGPPGPGSRHTVSGLRGLLLLNARLRN